VSIDFKESVQTRTYLLFTLGAAFLSWTESCRHKSCVCDAILCRPF